MDNMTKESDDILKIVKEDILRILGEKQGKISLKIIKEEIKVFSSFISKAIEELEKGELIQHRQKFFELTEKGGKDAKNILNKHFILEDYFKEKRNEEEAHKAAHILEHYISREVIDNIKKLSTFRKEDVPLISLDVNQESIVTDLAFSDYGLFERIVSMGISLGEKIEIISEISNGFVLKIRNKKFALDRNIAKEIMVYPINYEES